MTRKMLSLALAAVMTAASAASAGGNTGTVEEVLRGDMVRIGETFVAWLTGVKAPAPDTEAGRMIRDFTRGEIEGKLVKFSTWTTDNTAAGIVRDAEGRAFVQIFCGENMDTSIGEVLIRKGFAEVDREHLPEELAYYLDLEKEARERGLGIWAEGRKREIEKR